MQRRGGGRPRAWGPCIPGRQRTRSEPGSEPTANPTANPGPHQRHYVDVTGDASGLDDATLVAAARSGDKGAFAALVQRHRPMALALATRLLGSNDVAGDAVQEAALAALVSIGRLRDPGRFGAWFAGIALNVARRWRREAMSASMRREPGAGRCRPRPLDRWAASAPSPDDAAEAASVAEEIQLAVRSLPPGQRQAVLAFYWGDRSHAEAAAELGITPGAVKARLHQARTNLQPRLAQHARSTTRAVTAPPPIKEALMPSTPDAGTPDPGWVPVEVADVRRSPGDNPDQRFHTVVLREHSGDRTLPIHVGAAEATALACSLESVEMPRPMTYAMAASLLAAGNGRVVDVRITNLAERTHYGAIRVDGPNGVVEVDARPSDALNLALVVTAPILVRASLLDPDAACEDRWADEWQGFPSARPAIAGEVRARMEQLERLATGSTGEAGEGGGTEA